MSLFRRKDEATTPPAPEPTSVPTARDPDLAVPPFRPAAVVPPAASAAATSAKPTITPSPAARPSTPTAGRPTGRAEAGEKRVLQLGKGISIQGSVTEAERIVIEGTMESQLLQCQELAISHSGVFKGEVQVEDADIAGVFDGTLTATGSLIIRATGRVLGVARSRRLSVEDGGQLTGRMEMITEAPSSPAMAVAPPVRVVESSES
ncbi:MAG: polymer-forming cytoskeletal protein [Roseomonas sp.]|jgi:cytoskeletal protein CcmA (bactofilin family)|nr:polymer-forming cytoskeletal protein [Roseomonas sp.]MCZ8140849.1 polymer-forming cytoskeletal protein [Acetobacteraceae bacterium]MCA3387223.1 polymer-forming cytoskeletal protein [Roseomonas sp.]MCA3392511.1 polymer-forming cytoskeletal protein [Roseomonas sp.]MCA3408547.1 polymer-forming cytoskeletal protein [Roseomonas sp.]